MRHTLLRLLDSATLPKIDCRVAFVHATVCLVAFFIALGCIAHGWSQTAFPGYRSSPIKLHQLRARRYLAGREAKGESRSAGAFDRARRQQAAMLAQPRDAALTNAWHPVGPLQIGSLAYGNVTGRVTAIAIDPSDVTGNTVYVGTTGGGVWKSTNAVGTASNVLFTPLTDTLPVFSLDAGNFAIPSLSIGALSVANGIVLAGTGDPNDALDSYYGSGLLRSADGGATWTLVQDSHDGVYGQHSFVGLGFAGFAWSTVSTSVAVAAVSDAAEGVLENAVSTPLSVRGLYYSTDSGVTWQMATIKDGTQTVQAPEAGGLNQGGNAATAVVWNPVRQRFYAAIRYHGYYESTDGSVWTRLASQPGTGLTVASCPTNSGSTGSASCPIFRGALAVQSETGDTFAFTVDAQNFDQGIWRDVCGMTNSVCADSEAIFGTRLGSASLEQGNGSIEILQGDYDLSLAAVASGTDTLLFAGTIDLYRCSLGAGCAFRNTTNVEDGCSAPALVAPAQHAIAASTISGGTLLYLGNDGGLWRSTDGVNQQGPPCSSDDATHFQNLNSGLGSLAEVVSFSQHPSDADTLLVSVGANGTAATSTASSNAPWPQLAAGEGGSTAIDPATPANWYISTSPSVAISYCGKGSACAAADFSGLPTIGPTQVANDESLIEAPWLLDPALTSNALIGTCRVWRGPAADGSGWSSTNALSTDFGGTKSTACGNSNSFVRSLAVGGPVSASSTAANAGSEVLYAGLAGTLDGGGNLGGHLFSTTTGNLAGPTMVWTDLALSPVTNDSADGGIFNPTGFDVSSLTVDSHDPTGNTVYATLTGFAGNNLNAPHAYRSTDAGAHWTDITSNLPNAPASSIAVDPSDANTLYIALDTGVYATSQIARCATASCWSVFGTGLPNSPVVQLASAPALSTGSGSIGLLRAATYGRGIWEIPLLTAAPPVSAQITMNPDSLNFPNQTVGTISSAQNITISNSGTAPLVVSSLNTSGPFQETDNCVGTTVAANETCVVQVAFLAAAPGMNTGALTVYANIAGGQSTAILNGIGAAPASIVLNPLSVDFGTLTVGQTSSTQNVTVSNTGGVSATLHPPSITEDFQITANTCSSTLPAGVSCTVAIVFSPTAAGTRDGAFTIADSAGTQNTSLTGIGASVATDTLSPLSVTFKPQVVGSASAASTVMLTNSGDTALTLIAAQITSGDFTVVNNCGSTLSGHAACTMQVAFAPQTGGAQTGVLTVSDQFHTQTISLSGTGLAPPEVKLTPNTLSFAATVTGQSAPPLSVTISNSGSGQLTIASITISGDFTETDNCAGVALVGSGTACMAKITFSPSSTGTRSGVLTVTGSASGQQATVALSGTGLAPAAVVLDPVSLAFGTVTLGSSSAAQNVTISSTGGVAATIQSYAIAGDFKTSATTCNGSLPPSTGCTVAVLFTPTVSGTRNGVLSVTDSVGTQTVTLTGSGASVATDSLSPTALTFPVQLVGTASTSQPITLTNTGDNALTLIAVQIANSNFTATNSCGPSLAGHSTCAIAVTSTPTINGPTSAVMTVSDQFRSQTVSLTGIGTAPPGVQLSPSSLNFSGTGIGQSSTSQTIQISNFGNGQLTVTSVAITGDFSESDTCAGKTLSGTANCAVQVTFLPTASGQRTGVLTVSGSTPGSTVVLRATASLTGTGDAPAMIVLDPASAAFGTVTLGSSSSPAQNITISNTGGVQATLQTPSITGDFVISANTCGATLAPSTGCTVAIIFTPTASGVRNGTLSVASSVGTQTAVLTGIGASSATDGLSPLSLTFAPQQVLTTSTTQPVMLTNTGDNALTLIAVQVSGGNFTVANGCGVVLNGHSSCTIAVSSIPAVVGPTSGVLTISDQFRSQTVMLSGSGLAPPGVSLSPAAGLTFAPTGVTLTSSPQTITLSNQGSSALMLGSFTAAGDFSIPPATNTCGSTVAAGTACTFQIVFAPTASGARIGSLSVVDNAAGSPQVLPLQGVGVDFSLNANGATSVTVNSGASAVYPLLLSSPAGLPGDAVLTCTGAPTNSTCVVVPASVPLGGSATLTATIETGVAPSAAQTIAPHPRSVWWVLVIPLAFIPSRVRRSLRQKLYLGTLIAFILLLSVLNMTGCGAGRLIPGSPSTGSQPPTVATPTGTYPITVSATSAGLTRSVTLTLVVQ